METGPRMKVQLFQEKKEGFKEAGCSTSEFSSQRSVLGGRHWNALGCFFGGAGFILKPNDTKGGLRFSFLRAGQNTQVCPTGRPGRRWHLGRTGAALRRPRGKPLPQRFELRARRSAASSSVNKNRRRAERRGAKEPNARTLGRPAESFPVGQRRA